MDSGSALTLGRITALLVEDDERLARFTADYLSGRDVEVTHVGDGEAALATMARCRFDVVVLDVVLPSRSGISVCEVIRKGSDIPIVMVTARAEEADRVLGLDVGADDYMVKPFSPRELLARMHAVIRRDRGILKPRPRPIQLGSLIINEELRTVFVGAEPISLTTAEFVLLRALAKHPGRIYSREQLLVLIHGTDDKSFDRAVDTQISRLRHKFAAHPEVAALIQTVRGAGYMLGNPSC
jgi:DNA-binding response OmpR family regulator